MTIAFAENFRDCCGAACGTLAQEKKREQPEYDQLTATYEALHREIKEKLGEDGALIR